jgi:hypothetical protein
MILNGRSSRGKWQQKNPDRLQIHQHVFLPCAFKQKMSVGLVYYAIGMTPETGPRPSFVTEQRGRCCYVGVPQIQKTPDAEARWHS